MDVEELRQRYKDGERDFSGIELRDVDLKGIDLSDVVFHRAKLINVDLSNAKLWKADLSEADLTGSNLSNANLWKANLRNAILTNTDLSYTNSTGADFIGTNIDAALNSGSYYSFVVDESKNKNTELLIELRELTRGLYHSYNSEGSSDSDYYIFLWDTASRGDFTLEKFLEAADFLVEVDSIDLLEGKFKIEEFSFILQDIKQYIVNREYFYFELDTGLLDEPIPVLIGNTEAGDWIGICPIFDIERYGEEEIGRIQDNASRKIEYKPLISGLKNLETVEIFNEELDWTLEGIAWEIAENRNNLLHNLLKSSNLINFYDDYERAFGREGFFGENDNYENECFPEREEMNKKISNIIKTRFNDIKIYWIGDVSIDVYIIGKIETGDWIAINTKLIQT
ncbi:pentapeptide repeat protein [Calothrix parasitica NIES-267]|uniref:Pentapeptide repeat protein n=1 Tax=Calothrix parasitica NIES-267 TaxID=1973488 RepID=A0A1Z4LPA7_9CYAN|nr:pentapeptide repeat protein [Calothrix parasitica NIES-267]